MLTIAKFGGSSLADSARFLQAAALVRQDPARQVVVVSAAGKRQAGDCKITDLLYLCHAHLVHGVSCWDLFRRVRQRYLEIRDGCGLSTDLEPVLDTIYEHLGRSADYAASRGEYLSARLMADLLGYQFVDAADWLRFTYDGQVDYAASRTALRSLAAGRRVVTPGFYGCLPDGSIHTFSRGGSDVTGALAAAILEANLYENWTDVPGVLEADPKLIPEAAPLARISYGQLQQLSEAGMQVLHEDAVAPVRRAGIPLNIRSTREPEKPGTMICEDCLTTGLALAGRRNLTLPGQPGTLALLAAAFPRDWDLTAALDQVDHVCLVREPGALRVLLADRDYPEAVRRLYDLGHSFHGYTVP